MKLSKQFRIRLKKKAQDYFWEFAAGTGLDFSTVLSQFLEQAAEKSQTYEVGSKIPYTSRIKAACVEDYYEGVRYQVCANIQAVGILVKSLNRSNTYFEVTHVFDKQVWDISYQYANIDNSLLKKLLCLKEFFDKKSMVDFYQHQDYKVLDTVPGSISKYFTSEVRQSEGDYPLHIFHDLNFAAKKIPLPQSVANPFLAEDDGYIFSIVHVKEKIPIGNKYPDDIFRQLYNIIDDAQFNHLVEAVSKHNIELAGVTWKRVNQIWEVVAA